MLWKEVWLDPGFRLGRGGLILLTLVTVFLVGQGLLLVVQHRHLSEEIRTNDTSGEVFILYSRFALDETLEEAMRQHVGRAVELLLSLGLLTVVARAAACVGGERDKRTLESLLATPVAADHLLAAKAFGSAVSLRWVAGPVVLVWLLGWQWGGLGWGGLGYLLLITPFLAGLAAALGLIVGVAAASTSRAIIAALALALAVGGWPWLLVTQVGWKVPSLLPEAVGWALPPFVLFLAVPWYATAWALGRRWRTPLGRGAAVLIGGCGLLLALELMVRGFAAWPATLNRREEYLAHLLMPPELIADALAGVTWRVTLGSWSDRPGWLALALLCYLNAALILGTLAAALFRRTCGRIDRS
jgi:hypothetical protein